MNGTKIYTLESIGDIVIRKVGRVKNFSITIKPFEGIRVTIPARLSYDEAEKFILQKSEWIKRNFIKIREVEERLTVFDHSTIFKTKFRTLELHPHALSKMRVQVTPAILRVFYPQVLDIKHESVQRMIRVAIDKTLLLEAREYLPKRVAELARDHDFRFQKLGFRNARTRWGSCSHNNRISLSIHLMRLPDHLIDYVILHELSHTRIKNHGPKFWALMDKVTGNAKGLEKEMKKHRIAVY